MANQRACKAWTLAKCWVEQWRGCQWPWEHGSHTPGPYLCEGKKGSCVEETWQGSRRQELPSTAKAGFNVSIHFICKFSPPVNRKFQGKNSCPANTENWEPCVSVKKTTLLSHPHSGFAAPLSLLSASCPRWVGVTRRLSVASGTTAFQITAVTLWLLLFFSCVNGAVRFSHSKP